MSNLFWAFAAFEAVLILGSVAVIVAAERQSNRHNRSPL